MENENWVNSIIENLENLFFNYDTVYLSDIFNPYRRNKEKFIAFENNYSKQLKYEVIFLYDGEVNLKSFTYDNLELENLNLILENYKKKFFDYLIDNKISFIEVMALKNDIIKFENDEIKHFLRQFARLERIEVIKIDSSSFDKKKFNRFTLFTENKTLHLGIDKRFDYYNYKEYFSHLGDKFYPQVLKKYDIKL